VQGGGCSGFSYKMAFETVKAPLDWEGRSNGINIYIDPKSFLYLAGIELDFQDSLMGRGFVFNNPNAKKTCGCGESFTV
jgi:iron-sulfur cluster assembly protein